MRKGKKLQNFAKKIKVEKTSNSKSINEHLSQYFHVHQHDNGFIEITF